MIPGEFESVLKWLKEINQGSPIRMENGPGGEADNNLFSPHSPFARLSEAPGARIFARSFQTQHRFPEYLHLERAPASAEAVGSRQEKHGYERRPRHKTKENRYEYKGRDRTKSKRHSKKTAKQSRKHTLNRDFHAPNVPQTRLTLASRPNMGIFGKGRTSSPIKSRELPDLIFSEMNFLSRRARLDREELPREDQQDRINKTSRRENDLQTQILQYFSNDYPEEAPIVEETAYPIERRDTSCQPESYAMATSNANVNRAMESAVLSPETKCKSPSKSVTPYTWSESECRHDERLTSPEICTKGILCADMDHQHISNEEKADKRYWDLDELKLLLKIREQRRNESRANKEPGTCDHSKRERQPDEAEDVSGSPSKNAKNDITSVREGFSSPPSSRTERSYSPSHGHPEPGTYTPGRQANSNLERHELKVTPNRLWFSGSRPTSQSCSPVIALHENPSSKWNDDAGPSNEIDLDAEFDNVIARICSRETAYDKDDDVIMKDFDAVYNSIVNSGDGDLTYANFFRVSSNQDYVFSRAGCPTHPLLGDIDEVCNSSLLSRATGHNPLPKSTFQNEGVQVTNNALYDAWNKFSQPIASAVGMGAAPFGVSTGFCWRQNKLY